MAAQASVSVLVSTHLSVLSTMVNVGHNNYHECLSKLTNIGFCGNSLDPASAPATGCTFPCDANKTQICGGSGVFDLYTLTNTSPASSTSSSVVSSTTSTSSSTTTSSIATPSTTPLTSGPYSYVGCYNEVPNARALQGASNTNTGGSVDNCEAFCIANGNTTYFYVEYYGQCEIQYDQEQQR